MLMLTLTARHLSLIMHIEDTNLRGRLQCHRAFHIVIVSPYSMDLVNGQYRDLLKIQAFRIHPKRWHWIHSFRATRVGAELQGWPISGYIG